MAGVFLTTVIVLILASVYSTQPDVKKVKGTMAGDWTPAIGDVGVVMQAGSTVPCPCPGNQCEIPLYVVMFPDDKSLICTGMFNYAEGQSVKITSVTNECLTYFVSAN